MKNDAWNLRQQIVHGIEREYIKLYFELSEINVNPVSVVYFSTDQGKSKCAQNLILILVYYSIYMSREWQTKEGAASSTINMQLPKLG